MRADQPGRHRPVAAPRAFTLIETLVVIAIVSMLVGLILPALGRSRAAAHDAICKSNVRQMSIALTGYTDDNTGLMFPRFETLPAEGTLWWFGFEAFGGPTAEGSRILDRSRGRLFPYYQDPDSVEICPSFALTSPHYKPKFTTNWTTYGPSLHFMQTPTGPIRTAALTAPAQSLAFADAAQLNAFQAPASPANPMFEQWYYINRPELQLHCPHSGRANVAYFDCHADLIDPDEPPVRLFPEAPLARPPAALILQIP